MNEQETELMTLLQRMQQQLTFLEKKLDTLLQLSQQSQPKPFERSERTFSKPFRPYGRPNRPGQAHGPSSHNQGQRHGRPAYGGPSREGNFAPKKKPYFNQGRSHS